MNPASIIFYICAWLGSISDWISYSQRYTPPPSFRCARYYHQLLAAVIVHPDLPTVLPLMPEAITRQDGASKNDCERNAAKRLLTGLRQDYPKLKLIVVEDSLASNGPHIELLKSLGMRYILGVKPGDHEALFDQVQARLFLGECH